ncbi:hypothetical protein CDAR_586621, partial [Caerostris darwini]
MQEASNYPEKSFGNLGPETPPAKERFGVQSLLNAISNLPMFISSTLVEEDMQMLRSM